MNLLENYLPIIEESGIGVWKLDLVTNEMVVNENYTALIGYTREELSPINTDTWEKYYFPEYVGDNDKLMLDHLAGKTDFYKNEIKVKHRDGSALWMLAKGKVTKRAEDGTPLIMVGTNQNITAQKKSEILLKKYKDLLQISNQVAETGTWEFDFIKRKVYWSKVTKQIFDAEPDFTPNVDEANEYFYEGSTREKMQQAVDAAIFKGENFDLELEVCTKKKNHKWVRLIGVSEFKNKRCIRLHGIIQDITKIKKERIATDLREEQFRQTFQYAPIGMALIGLDGGWMATNDSLLEMLGYTQEELYKLHFRDISHPDDDNKSNVYIKELIDKKRESFQIEKRYLHKTGAIVWVKLLVTLVHNDKGDPSHFVCQLEDITENKNLIDTMQDQNKRLINFSYIVSHNLRSHTGNISMLLDILAAEMPDFAENEFYTHLSVASAKLNETVQHLNEVVVINTKLNDSLLPLNIHDYVENALVTVNALIDESDTEVINKVEKNATVSAIPAYLESIILNFITNGIKYRSLERKSIIEISTEETKNNIIIHIKDNGIGIDMEMYGEKLFGMYKTFHKNKDSRGIGLFITKNQVEAIGGKIEVTSEVGKGTTFSVILKKIKPAVLQAAAIL